LPPTLPRTIEDAITVTKLLGHSYLWVDGFCIDQSDLEHCKHQIGLKDRIYSGAQLTIVAAAGDNKAFGLPGLNGTKRRHDEPIRVDDFTLFTHGTCPSRAILKSKWFTRAWTFQEAVLSKRLLVFIESQASLYC
ncbi:hypothetical protein EK21DRAFT_42077, partial [Setomelanomma holmii]